MPGFPAASGHVQMEPDGSHTPDSPAGGGALTSPVTRGLLLLGWQDGGTRGPPHPAPLSTREGTWGQGGPARGSPPPRKGPQQNLRAPGPCGSRSPPPLSGLHTPRFCRAGVCEWLDVRLIGKALALRWLRHHAHGLCLHCRQPSEIRGPFNHPSRPLGTRRRDQGRFPTDACAGSGRKWQAHPTPRFSVSSPRQSLPVPGLPRGCDACQVYSVHQNPAQPCPRNCSV